MPAKTPLAADRADQFITLAALAIIVLGAAYGFAGLGRLLPEPQRAAISWLELVCALGAVLLVLPGVVWKALDPKRRGQFAAALRDGFAREVVLKAAQIAWMSTAFLLYLLHTFARQVPDSLPRDTVIDFLLAFSLVAFGAAALVCHRSGEMPNDATSA